MPVGLLLKFLQTIPSLVARLETRREHLMVQVTVGWVGEASEPCCPHSTVSKIKSLIWSQCHLKTVETRLVYLKVAMAVLTCTVEQMSRLDVEVSWPRASAPPCWTM